MNKSNKGITLIALVITIIVLLILAGVMLFFVIGENGIIQKAKDTKMKHEIEYYREQIELAKGTTLIENNGEIILDRWIEEINKQKSIHEGEITKINKDEAIIKTKEEYVFTINVKGEIQYNMQEDIIDGIVSISEPIWSNGKATVSLKIEDESTTNTDFQIQYQINSQIPDKWVIGDKINNLNYFDVVYARLWDGKNAGSVTSLKIEIQDYEIIQNESRKIYLTENLIGSKITIDLEMKYGREENSTSIYFYDKDNNKIEGVGEKFSILGGTISKGIYSYMVPENCAYIEFWAGNGSFNPYIYLYSIKLEPSAQVKLETIQPIIQDTEIKEGYYYITLTPTKGTYKIMYQVENEEWNMYTEPIKMINDKKILVKGITKDGEVSLVENIVEMTGELITKDAMDQNLNTYYYLNNGKKVRLKVDKSVYGRNVRINLETKYGREENSTSIYFYDKDNNKIEGVGTYFYKEGGTTSKNIYTYIIPEGCEYIEFWSGDGSYKPYIKLYNITVE